VVFFNLFSTFQVEYFIHLHLLSLLIGFGLDLVFINFFLVSSSFYSCYSFLLSLVNNIVEINVSF
jgi:hypothetical protein